MTNFSVDLSLCKRMVLCTMLLLLGGCASQVPILIKKAPEPDVTFNQVKNDTSSYVDQHIRWGGEIISIENKEDSSWVEILVNPLNSFGEPRSDDDYKGRFIARVDGFLDPEHYAKGRELTIYGKVESTITRRIDEHPYNYPLVYAQVHYLWPEYKRNNYAYRPYPYYYRPYFFYNRGFYHRHRFGLHHYY